MSEGQFENIDLLLRISVIIGIMIIRGNTPRAIFFCDLISLMTHLDTDHPVNYTHGNEGSLCLKLEEIFFYKFIDAFKY